jgi:ribonuclease BN (tRNA processing enzyme)
MKQTISGTEIVLLGTAGGPRLRTNRAGIASAVVVGDALYLVDFGYGACRQSKLAGLDLGRLRAGFVTHLHSDHIADLANLLLFGWYENLEDVTRPVHLYGPGSRGRVAAPSADLWAQDVVCPDDPMPGFAATVGHLAQAFATDINDRMRDNGRSHPGRLLEAYDIELPASVLSISERGAVERRQIEYFLAVIDQGSITAAAATCTSPSRRSPTPSSCSSPISAWSCSTACPEVSA